MIELLFLILIAAVVCWAIAHFVAGVLGTILILVVVVVVLIAALRTLGVAGRW